MSRPIERFLRIEAASGVLLLVSAGGALAWANSPWAASYDGFWLTPVGVRVGAFSFERSLQWFVNDGLMALFFFVVGLEIRREIHSGALSQWKRAALPASAALGGMLVPAGTYLLLAPDASMRPGWGVPMATDIAFAVGVLTMLGKRVPPALRVLLLALAVIDDLGAIVVIALFYSGGVSSTGFFFAAGGLGGIWVLQRLGVRNKAAYAVPALLAWAGVYAAGVHPTIAGVAIGLMTPVRAWLERGETLSPSESLVRALHPWVAFAIMPLFALANSGVALDGASFDAASWRVALAVAAGLVLGKPLGVLTACLLTLRLGLSRLPDGVRGRDLLVLGVVAGVGFTMSLFIAQLAFPDPRLLGAAKVGIFVASCIAGIAGILLGRAVLPEAAKDGEAPRPTEAPR